MLSITKKITALYNQSLVQDTISTTLFSTFGKTVGFLIPFFIAAWFGVTQETDAFFFAYGLILFLSSVFAPVVENIIVPYITEARAKKEDVGKFVGKVLCVSGIGLLALSGVFFLFITPLLSLLTRFDSQTLILVYHLIIETIPLLIFLTWTSVLVGALNAYKKFTYPAISPAFRAIVNLSIIYFFKDVWGVHAIAFGYVVGELFRLIALAFVIKKLGTFKLHLSFIFDAQLRKFLKVASYQTIGMIGIGLKPLVDKAMASWLGEGNVSVIHYADRLYIIPVTFIISGLMVTLLSHWSGTYYQKGLRVIYAELKKAIMFVFPFAVFVVLVLIIVSKYIVAIVYGHGEFSNTEVSITSATFNCYLVGFPFYMGSFCLTRVLVATKKTVELMWMALFGFAFNIVFNYLLMHLFGVKGIALSTSLVSALGFCVFIYRFRNYYRKEEFISEETR